MKDYESGKSQKKLQRIFLNLPFFFAHENSKGAFQGLEVRGDLASLGTASVANAM